MQIAAEEMARATAKRKRGERGWRGGRRGEVEERKGEAEKGLPHSHSKSQ